MNNNTLYLNPEEVPDGGAQALVDNIPEGGKLVLTGKWKVHKHGTLHIKNVIDVEGTAMLRENPVSMIVNSGTKMVNKPCMVIGTGVRMDGVSVRNLAIDHTSPLFPAVIAADVVKMEIHRVFIDLHNQGWRGIELVGGTYFTVLNQVSVRNFTDNGVLIRGEGSEHNFYDCHIYSEDADCAVQTENRGTSFYNGQINTDNVGIRFYGNRSNAITGVVNGVLCESGTAVEIDAPEGCHFRNVDIYSLMLGNNAKLGVRFGKATECTVHSIARGNPGGLIEFTADATRCGVQATPTQLSYGITYGGTGNWVRS